jgi:ribosomal protein L11 methyltransferase
MSEWTLRDSRQADHVLHPSTQGMAEAMSALSERFSPQKILDIGCGSGILSLIALELWRGAALTAADVSEQAMEDCEENFAVQGLLDRVTICRSYGFSNPAITAGAPYDLILCNLLAEWLVRLVPDVTHHLQSGGFFIASGILAWMAPQVIEGYASYGFELAAEIHAEEWRTLMFHKP